MKTLLLLPFIVFSLSVNAKTYYVSNSGNDANSGTDISSPWQTLNKINSFKGFVAGDNILFERGDTFYGQIIISNSGSSGNPLTFGAYGSGANPVITGFTNVKSWANVGGNIWESSNAVSSLATCNMVVIDGKNTPMGRYPNTGYLTYQSHVNSTSITSSSLTGTPNWTGADAAIKVNHWTVNRVTISSQSGGTLTFPAMSGNGTDNFGFFIENDIRTLDAQNEWYYNPSTKKISAYSTSQPNNVMVASVDTVINVLYGRNYIQFENISVQGANQILLFNGGNNSNIINCTFSFCGWDGLKMAGCYNSISNNILADIGENGVYMFYGSPGYNVIKNNIFKRTNLVTGVLENDYCAAAIRCYSPNSLVQYNDIDSSGYNGIQFKFNNVQVRNNLINHSALLRDDAGGIYTGFANETGKVIDGNIILNTIGNYDGTDGTGYLAHGIYIDDLGTGVTITNNTIANCNNTGIFLHNANNCNVRNNTIYNCGTTPAVFTKGALFYKHEAGYTAITNNTIKNNIFFSKEQGQIPYFSSDNTTNAPISYGVMDSNYYAKPLSGDANIFSVSSNIGGTSNYNLAQWQSSMGMDAHSKGSPKSIQDVNDLRFECNATTSSKTISLGAKYIDVKGNAYNGSIILAPYTSMVLIKDGPISTNIPPVATAGKDQAITLPLNSIQLLGNGSDADGTIVSYIWTKISGPSSGTIGNTDSASAMVSELVMGTYQFELKVIDNQGGVGKDTVSVTVNAAANIPPTANAGNDLSITLPTNTTPLSGSGSDVDGTIASYQWTKISGPSAYNILNPNSASTNVSGLVQGLYQFQLTVTDNAGAIGTAIVQITVNAAPNIPPTATAGTNQTITFPVNSVSLTGSGNDADGTIDSYQWTNISGPSVYNIVSPNSATTNVTELVQGVYVFQLTVTDNGGAIGTATVQITVNAATNIPPNANAGTNQTITLPANSVSLSGSGSDIDGTVASYQWVMLSGQTTYNIVNPSSSVTNVTGLTQGVYTFQLTVTDNNGAIGTSTVQITVNAAANIPPTANAGTNQMITLPANSVSLTGSGNDSDGTIASYQWTKISGPSSFNVVSPGSASTIVSGLVQGVYQFQLTVTDNGGAIGTGIVWVTVNPTADIPPIANAGSDVSISLPTNSVSLTGSGSDADGTITTYQWTKISGPSSYNIASPDSASTGISGLVQGVYQFQLTVTDDKGEIGTATVQVAVNATPNIPPTANAGANQTIILPANSVSLSGSGSDADGTISTYQWSKISGPSSYNIVNPSSPATDVSGLVQGVYQFQLSVTDNDGAIGSATIKVIVNAAANIPPNANAGSNKSINLPVNSVSLTGSGSDTDGTIASYQWIKISGPSAYNIVSPNSSTTNITGLIQGLYQFQLTVTDNAGAIGAATVQVQVNAAANQPPTANAGTNQTITLPTNIVSLTGSGSDADATIASYKWTEISGPSVYNIVNPSSTVTDVSGLVQGVYRFQLTVTDNNGAIGTSTILITVNAASNIPPTANAGSNKSITLLVNSVSLAGSGNDADGTIASYQWSKISGPSVYNMVNSSSPVTDVSGMVQGVYHFQLTVTDNDGAIGTATVQITVNAASNIPPTANAGTNQTITLPANSGSLTGSGSDADGTIASYQWTKISGPSTYNIVSPNSASTTVSGLSQGVYQFQLTVTDNGGAIGKATVQITVNAAPNIPPTANAGTNQTITLPANSGSLTGSGSDADGTIASYQWTKISGPSIFNIVNPSSPVTVVSGLVQGVYKFQLTVTDNKGDVGTGTVQITVDAGLTTAVSNPNIAPKANAGNDTTIVAPNDSVTLKGSATDVDGSIVGYLWNQISGPSVSTISSGNTAITNISNVIEGTYAFELTVTDNSGAKGKDTVMVTVALGRYAPVANTVNVYPNPVHDVANIEINTGKLNTNLVIVITDMSGRAVYKEQFVSSNSEEKKQINMSNLIKGSYVITVYFDGMTQQSVKVIRL